MPRGSVREQTDSGSTGGEQPVISEPPSLEDALEALRGALRPYDILTALQAIGLDAKDLAEGVGADERTVRRWLGGDSPNRSHQKPIGALRVSVIHMLQRRGLSVESIVRWLRLPDAELGFVTPLTALAENRLPDVIVAHDAYIAPRPGTSLRQVVDREGDGEEAVPAYETAETGEFCKVSDS